MKRFNEYIFENEIKHINEAGFLDKLKGWFKKLFKSEEKVIQTYLENGKKIKCDLKNIKSPDKPMNFKDVLNNEEEMKCIELENYGFPITSKIFNNYKQYFEKIDPITKEKITYNVLVDRYFYNKDDIKMFAGIILFDKTIRNDDNYINLFNIEIAENTFENEKEILKYISNVFETNMKNEKFKGIHHNKIEPKLTSLLTTIGYKTQNNNKNILFKNFV